MRKLALLVIVFSAAAGGTLHAQDITGSWQGTLQPPGGGPALRIVMQLSKADQGLRAVMHSIDQGAQPINAATVTLQGSILKIAVPALGGNYEGRLAADGNSITGTWTQGAPAPLNLARATPATAWAIPEPAPPPAPMAANANLVFEVATIKPANPEVRGQSILVSRSGMFTTTNTTLNDLITFAWGIHARQIVGGQSWLESELFDITAKPEQTGIPNATQLRTMAQKLLAERFGLAMHTEKRELSAYVLTVGKTGPKLSKNDSGGNLPGFGGMGPGAIGVRNSTMAEFAGFLQARILDRPVVDQTGLSGKFDFTLEWRPDTTQSAPGANPPPQLPPAVEARPDLFTAIQEQIGLKLEASRAPVEVYVIDKVQKPSEN